MEETPLKLGEDLILSSCPLLYLVVNTEMAGSYRIAGRLGILSILVEVVLDVLSGYEVSPHTSYIVHLI